MKKIAAVSLFVLFTVSCRGGVIPPVTPAAAPATTRSNDELRLKCSTGQNHLRVTPAVLALSLTSGSARGTLTACALRATSYRLTASPSGVVAVPSKIRPAVDPKSGMKEAVISVRALRPGRTTITIRDAFGGRVTVAVTVALSKLYVAERKTIGDVKVFNTTDFSQPPFTIGSLDAPEGVAVAMDPASGKLYVSENSTGDVRVYDTLGNCPYQLTATITGFNGPAGVAVDAVAQMLYVTEIGDVKVYSTANGQYTYVTTLGSAAGIDIPGGLAVDPDAQKLYVAQGSNNVKIFNTADLSQPPSTITDVSQPGGVAIDHIAAKVYVTENVVGDVRVYDENTNQDLGTIGTGLVEPYGDAVDPGTGKLYVVEYGNGDVKIFDTQHPTAPPATLSGLTAPWAVAVGP